jgi:porin
VALDEVALQAGVFDVNPLVTLPQNGFKLNLSGSTGVVVPVELGYQIGKNPSDYGGTYKIGAYYDSSAAANLANPNETDSGRYGLYIEAAQQVFKTGPDLRNGLPCSGSSPSPIKTRRSSRTMLRRVQLIAA